MNGCEKLTKELLDNYSIIQNILTLSGKDFTDFKTNISIETYRNASLLLSGWFTFKIENETFFMVRYPNNGNEYHYSMTDILIMNDSQNQLLNKLANDGTSFDEIIISNLLQSVKMNDVTVKLTHCLFPTFVLTAKKASKVIYDFDDD